MSERTTAEPPATEEEPPPPAIEEPSHLCCPITHALYRDPVFVPESGNTYEREAILAFWQQPGTRRDALTNVELNSDALYANFDKRREVASFMAAYPTYVPQGWQARDDIPPVQPGRGAQQQLPRGPRRCWPSLKLLTVVATSGASFLSGFGLLTVDAFVDDIDDEPWHNVITSSCTDSRHGRLADYPATIEGKTRGHWLLHSAIGEPGLPRAGDLGLNWRRGPFVSVLLSADEQADEAKAEAAAAAAGRPILSDGKHGWHDEAMKRRTASYSQLRRAEHGLRLDVPRLSLPALVASGGECMRITPSWSSSSSQPEA